MLTHIKHLSILAVLLAGLIALVGCQNPAGDSADPIVGTWTLASVTNGGVTQTAAALGQTMVFVVAANNTFTGTTAAPSVNMTGTQSGTWSKSGSAYTLTTLTSSQTSNSGTSTNNTPVSYPVTVNDSTLTLTAGSNSATFTRS